MRLKRSHSHSHCLKSMMGLLDMVSSCGESVRFDTLFCLYFLWPVFGSDTGNSPTATTSFLSLSLSNKLSALPGNSELLTDDILACRHLTAKQISARIAQKVCQQGEAAGLPLVSISPCPCVL